MIGDGLRNDGRSPQGMFDRTRRRESVTNLLNTLKLSIGRNRSNIDRLVNKRAKDFLGAIEASSCGATWVFRRGVRLQAIGLTLNWGKVLR